MRWAVSQCVGQWEGGRERGCARLLGGGELLKVQCESGDISHLLETLPNYLVEVPEIKAAGGESPSSYLRRSEREEAGDRGGGVGKNTHFKSCTPPLAGSAGAPGVACVCVCVCACVCERERMSVCVGGGARWGLWRRRRAERSWAAGRELVSAPALLRSRKTLQNARRAPSC